ncbi:hypothetical protein EC991_005302 [Linnemannia zychae]|nr:hypothetical protein EC991_005302 [Linnemannia zychae]
MSKNPYFAHLPTWRNRQDLAYAIDSLPTILETLTASSPLLATYSYPSTTSSRASSSHSHSSASGSTSSSPCSPYSSAATTTSSATSYYPLQFSTRARAMAYLIEILQSLQKEHCGCDLVKGCYCGQDGIEDHEGKSPCYVCGEWYPDRRERTGGVGPEGDIDSTRRQQGKSWHEQGSLRHHVAEAKVKKWLDAVWKPPLTPATTPEQENVRQFGLRSHEDLRQCFDHPHYQHPQQQQQQSVRMEPGRPWSVYDIEIEARSKSRSRNNSASSNHSMSFVTSPSTYYPSATTTSSYPSAASPQQDLSGSAYKYGSSSGQWNFSASPAAAASPSSPSPSSKSVQATPPSKRAGKLFWAPPSEAYGFSSLHADSQGYSQARIRTMSCSDAPSPSGNPELHFGSPVLSMRSSTPPVMRSSSYHTAGNGSNNNSSSSIDRSARSKPVRASTTNSTFSIPQEILDPNYRSPTFRIKSWSPAPSSSSSGASPSSAFSPVASRLSMSNNSSPSGDSQDGKKQTLDGWASSAEGVRAEKKPLLSTPLSIPNAQESVLRSSKMDRSDQEDCCMALSPPPEVSGQQGNTREDPTSPVSISSLSPTSRGSGVGASEGEEVKKSAPFQFNFTSTRFRAAVQAKASMDSLKSATAVQARVSSGGVQFDSVQKSAAVHDEEILQVQQSKPTTTTVTNNDSRKEDQQVKIKTTTSGATMPAPVAVVIVTEEIVMREPDANLQDPAPSLAPVSSFVSSKSTTSVRPASSSRSINSIQKSAPLSPPTPLVTSRSASFPSSSSSSASTSAAAAALTSTSTSNCSPGPKSPNKNHCTSNGTGDVQRATSWSSLQKLMQTMTVTAPNTSLGDIAWLGEAGFIDVMNYCYLEGGEKNRAQLSIPAVANEGKMND